MNRQVYLSAIFSALGVFVGFALVIDKQSSDMALWFLMGCVLILLVPIAVLFLAVAQKWKILLHLMLVPALLGFLSFHLFNLIYWPSNIRVGFGSPPGSSGSYHIAQFYHRVGENWIEGPSVLGRPMRVSFPDLNSDGYKDIRVVEENGHSGDAIEFVFVPTAQDGIHWKAFRLNSRLLASYEPAGLFHNYP